MTEAIVRFPLDPSRGPLDPFSLRVAVFFPLGGPLGSPRTITQRHRGSPAAERGEYVKDTVRARPLRLDSTRNVYSFRSISYNLWSRVAGHNVQGLRDKYSCHLAPRPSSPHSLLLIHGSSCCLDAVVVKERINAQMNDPSFRSSPLDWWTGTGNWFCSRVRGSDVVQSSV